MQLANGAPATSAPRFLLCRGFSLVELSIVLVIVAVLAYVSVRMLRPAEGQAFQQAERLRNDLRHVQTLAATQAKVLQIKFGTVPGGCPGSGDGYWVIECTQPGSDPCTGSPNTPVTHRGTGQAFCVVRETGLTITGSDLYFDAMGRPKTGTSFTNATTTFNVAGGASLRQVTVAPVTGFASLP